MSIVLDTQAILILYLGEKGADDIADLLSKVAERKIKGYMNIINLAEFYYILARKNVKVADEKEQNLKSFGVKIVSVKAYDELWREAAILKAGNSLRGFTPLTYKMPELTVEARTLDGKTALHMYAIIDPQSSDTAAGTVTYKVYPGNFGNTTFDHWDNGSTQAVRTLTIHEDTTISAYYRVG